MPDISGQWCGCGRILGQSWWLLVLMFVNWQPQPLSAAEDTNPCLACDREMRKTFEAMQAWRRMDDGRYPARIADLKAAQLLPVTGGICPEVLRESAGASATHGLATSRADSADPPGTYEYEMSAKVDSYVNDKLYLPKDARPYTRQDLKSVLLRRPYYEQIPILRCSSHRAASPKEFSGDEVVFRNFTVRGNVYWSGLIWEQCWLDEVPVGARGTIVMFGAQGPPFSSGKTPTLPQALDLGKWSCALGEEAWWWGFPMFEEGPKRQTAADLSPLFQHDHGRVMRIDGLDWWLDGLVQLRGRARRGSETYYEAADLDSFVAQKTGAVVGRKFSRAAWLQGTLWTAEPGETTGWLVWNYADGAQEKVPIIYGTNTARFWAEPAQIEGEKDFPAPAWSFHQTEETVGRERWVRLYRQDWTNPRPEVAVVSLDFMSQHECRAEPFLIAVDVLP
jgi:hypothetical protein